VGQTLSSVNPAIVPRIACGYRPVPSSDRHTPVAIPDVVTSIATSIAASIAAAGEVAYLGATHGIAVLHGDPITSYFVDRTASGRYMMAVR
jgi:hypothetical protein